MLRQEEGSIKTLQLDTNFVLWMRTGLPAGLPESLHAVSQQWRLKKEKAQVTSSLRQVLWLNMWAEVGKRLDPSNLTPELKSNFVKAGYLAEIEGQHQWPYLQWDPQEKTLKPDPSRKALSLEEAHKAAQHLLEKSGNPHVITRFHPTRPLAAELKEASLTFMVSIANRTEEANHAHQALMLLAGSGCTQVAGISLRPERLNRSPIVNSLSKQLQALESRR